MDRRYVLAGVAAVVGVVAALILRQVLATVFFAATVAYVLAPVDRWYVRRGLSSWWAALATTVTAVGIATAVLSPLAAVLYLRFGALQELLSDVPIPEQVTLSAFGVTQTVEIVQLQPAIVDFLQEVALGIASAAPVVIIKLTLFAIVVFALLLAREQLHVAVRNVIPITYHDAAARLTDRARDTLFAIYVLQAATAIVTFLVAVPVFVVLGYEYPFTLATLAGFLQFLPIVGPSVLVAAVAAIDLAIGNLTRAVLVTVVGLVLIAWLPDPVVRPRLARRTADLPGSLYFVGFTGGLFTLGVVGVVAGPLVVALLSEATAMLAEEMENSRDRQTDLGAFEPDAAPASDPGDRAPPPDATPPPDGDPTPGVSPEEPSTDGGLHPPGDRHPGGHPPDATDGGTDRGDPSADGPGDSPGDEGEAPPTDPDRRSP
jgi:predicted PurR-regulated permease PerM